MRKEHSRGRSLLLSVASALIVMLFLTIIGIKYKSSNPDLEGNALKSGQKEELLARMRINLLKSADIEKGAVMAETDELSRLLADESIKASDAVEGDRVVLGQLVEEDKIPRETGLLREFDSCWVELRRLDKVILEFSVENTNIKASKLSFGQGRRALERFEKSIEELVSKAGVQADREAQFLRLVAEAMIDGFKIQQLMGPHIAAAGDEDMDRMEKEIARLNGLTRQDLQKVEELVPEQNRHTVKEAEAAWIDFEGVTAEVVKLSRKNTNVKSLELSLGQKRKVMAHCDETLASLQSAVRDKTSAATR
ncbi:MAG: hypothetical protein LLG06_08185 [Desulfobacteraceae bacterium]|nr:hypothetical protein [Desulfobacteraceae bacterium]